MTYWTGDLHSTPQTNTLSSIVSERYGGSYSGGEYTAWPDFYNLPKAIEGDDIACSSFWLEEVDNSLIGIGSIPEESLNDLLKKVEKDINKGKEP